MFQRRAPKLVVFRACCHAVATTLDRRVIFNGGQRASFQRMIMTHGSTKNVSIHCFVYGNNNGSGINRPKTLRVSAVQEPCEGPVDECGRSSDRS